MLRNFNTLGIVCSAMAGTTLLFFAITSCTKEKGLPEKAVNTTIDSSRLVDVKYSEDIVPIMTTYCYGTGAQKCHVNNSNQGAVDMSSHELLEVYVSGGSIENRVFSSSADMPPSYSDGPKTLDATDLAVFKKWVSDGAPNN